ncbi:HEAT repeat domain-containing protein [Sphaerisporangium sp. NPDC051011]|uniref:HEAT repeat domain-containing protein n=1 Tax=Sphaerisporangium sp. NPDC051011 TaxID=3155792 RepID=UPI0033D43BBB
MPLTSWREALGVVDWTSLEDGKDEPRTLPDDLIALTSDDAYVREVALESLGERLSVEGVRYSATPPAASLLIRMLREEVIAGADTGAVLRLIRRLVFSDEDDYLFDGFTAEGLRAIVLRKSRQSESERDAELRRWVEEAPTPESRKKRESNYKWMGAEAIYQLEKLEIATHDSIMEGVPVYCTYLVIGERAARLQAAALLGYFPERAVESMPALLGALDSETDPDIMATMLIAIGLLGPGSEPAAPALRSHLSSPETIVRWASAIALAWHGAAIDGLTLRLLRECFTSADELQTGIPYHYGLIGHIAEEAPKRLPRHPTP